MQIKFRQGWAIPLRKMLKGGGGLGAFPPRNGENDQVHYIRIPNYQDWVKEGGGIYFMCFIKVFITNLILLHCDDAKISAPLRLPCTSPSFNHWILSSRNAKLAISSTNFTFCQNRGAWLDNPRQRGTEHLLAPPKNVGDTNELYSIL